MVVRENGWRKLVLCLLLSLFLGLSGLVMPETASAGDISVAVTGEGNNYQVAAAPVLTADTTDNIVGQAVDITFTDDEGWSAAISSIKVNGIDLGTEQYAVSSDKITFASEVFTKTGDHEVLVKAAGYSDGSVIQTIEAEPDLSSNTANNEVEEDIEQVSTDSSDLIMSTEAKTEEKLLKLMEAGDSVLTPPVLTPDTTDNVVGQPVEITFSADEGWSGLITNIIVNSKDLTTEQYTVSSDKITLAVGVFTKIGNFEVVVKATGYADASVTQAIEKYVLVTGDGVATPTIFTMSDLAAMNQVPLKSYSTINTWPTKKMVFGRRSESVRPFAKSRNQSRGQVN